jgi:hypothetical protein
MDEFTHGRHKGMSLVPLSHVLAGRPQGRLDLRRVLDIAVAALTQLEEAYADGRMARMLSPDTLLMSLRDDGSVGDVLCSDLCVPFRDEAGVVLRYAEGLEPPQPWLFASINALGGVRPAPRDNLESLGCVLVHALRGGLPWASLETAERVRECKTATPLRSLTEGAPQRLRVYFEYARALRYADKPNYAYLRTLLTAPPRGSEAALSVTALLEVSRALEAAAVMRGVHVLEAVVEARETCEATELALRVAEADLDEAQRASSTPP